MTHNIMRSRLTVLMFACVAALSSLIACGSEQTAGPNGPPAPAGPIDAANDSTPANADSTLAPDTAAVDSAATPDSLVTPDSLASDSAAGSEISEELVTLGVPYGPYHLMNSYTTYAWGPAPFTASLNGNTGPGGVIKQIDAARRARQKLMLSLTDGYREHYLTNGKFDIAKWKTRMYAYNTPEIRAAVARGISDGTILGNQVINEPNVSGWGGNINKAVVDQLCTHVKKIFPTLPAGPVVVHWWRPTERYRVCDFIIDQYGWSQGSMGPGTPGGSGNVLLWRQAALTQAAKEGISIAFSMNLLGGGTRIYGCPVPETGGRYTPTDMKNCRMTADQVRQWGRALGPYGCAMFMWKYEAAFWSKSANIQAFRDVAATLATKPRRSCRRPG